MDYSPEQIEQLLQGIFDGTYTPHDLPEDLYMAIAQHLEEGLYKGFGGDLGDFSGADQQLLNELRENVYMFSGAKTYQQINDISLVKDDGIKSFKEFRDEALKIYDQYNVNWLETERSTAIGQAQNAVRWNQIEKQKDTLPLLRYSDVEDDNECEICAPLGGIVLPVDDSFWDEYMPLNHFNCRCTVEQLPADDAEVTASDDVDERTATASEEMQPLFKMNPGKDGYVFSPEHPYFDVAPKDRSFAENNFNLPIPEAPAMPETGLSVNEAEQAMSHMKISESERQAVKNYTGGDYASINSYLRNLRSSSAKNESTISELDKFITKAPKVEAESYRGITVDEEQFKLFKGLKKGDPFTDNGYISTSYDKSVATNFGGSAQWQVEMTIKGKNGVLIEGISDAKKEKEILFARGSTFKVESVKSTGKTGIYGKISVTLREL